ncbi:hypothetical protein [Mycolicibacterium thermoresistibile]|jgi:hypothetical protein|nr:hypothetical protein [Mycolicibacterium thermoresistibile]
MLTAVIVVTGCDSMAAPFGGVSEPLTPEQARDQAVDAARDVVSTLDLPVAEAHFSRAACRDNGGGPYRGQVTIKYPKADSYDAATAEIEQMVQRLFAAGWDDNTDFRTHGKIAHKDGVVAVFRPQSSTAQNRMIDVLGECRDTTTTWETRGGLETLTLP